MSYVDDVLAKVIAKNPSEPEFHQAVTEVFETIRPLIEANEEEYKKALEDKLVEELNEVLESTGNNRIEELSDMIEVITSLAKLEGKTLNDVIEASSKKKEKRGGFDNKIFLLKVTTKE